MERLQEALERAAVRAAVGVRPVDRRRQRGDLAGGDVERRAVQVVAVVAELVTHHHVRGAGFREVEGAVVAERTDDVLGELRLLRNGDHHVEHLVPQRGIGRDLRLRMLIRDVLDAEAGAHEACQHLRLVLRETLEERKRVVGARIGEHLPDGVHEIEERRLILAEAPICDLVAVVRMQRVLAVGTRSRDDREAAEEIHHRLVTELRIRL